MDFLTNYISVVGLVVALGIGYILKNIVPNQTINGYIPLISAIVGLVIVVWDAGWIATPEIIATGIVSGLAATGLYEAFKNFLEMTNGFQPTDKAE